MRRFSKGLRSLSDPIWPRPPALVTAIARGAVAEPAIWRGRVVSFSFVMGVGDVDGRFGTDGGINYERCFRPWEAG